MQQVVVAVQYIRLERGCEGQILQYANYMCTRQGCQSAELLQIGEDEATGHADYTVISYWHTSQYEKQKLLKQLFEWSGGELEPTHIIHYEQSHYCKLVRVDSASNIRWVH